VVGRREDAEYLAYLKIAKVTTNSRFFALLGPLILNNAFGYWLKVVSTRNHQTVFAYQDYFVPLSPRDPQATARQLGRAIAKQQVRPSPAGI
jgi:hypothetical protein